MAKLSRAQERTRLPEHEERGAHDAGEEPDDYSDEDLEGGFEDLEAGESGADDDEEAVATDGDEYIGDVPVHRGGSGRSHGTLAAGTGPEDDPSDGVPRPSLARPATAARFAVPSHDEVHGLKETSELYMNNVFKMQLDEMMIHVRPAYERAGALELVLRRLHTLLASLPAIPAQSLERAHAQLEAYAGRKVRVLFPEPLPRANAPLRFSFVKPSKLSLIGSWPLRAAARRPGTMDVDVEVCMPRELFQEKDTFNARYFHKRAFYLAVLAESIRRADSGADTMNVDVRYEDVAGDRRRTCLLLTPRRGAGDADFGKLKVAIRIHPAHDLGTFPVARLAPDRNSLRGAALSDSAGDAARQPTPRYNACILADSLRLAHLVFLHGTSQACGAFTDACALLKTWATQRGFGALRLTTDAASAARHAARRTVAGTENARFVLSMLLAHLLHGDERAPGGRGTRPKLSSGFSSYQLLRGVLDFLAKHNFAAHPVFMRAQPKWGLASQADQIPPAAFSAMFSRAFVDPSGCVNLLADWPPSSLDLLQADAAQALRMLNDAEGDHFATLFLTPDTDPTVRFDEAAALTLPRRAPGDLATRLDYGNARAAGVAPLLDVGARALGKRASVVAAMYPANALSSQPWATDADAPSVERRVELGVQLNPEYAWRQVEHGPEPTDTAAADAFRAFWGSLAELRRFRDGRVQESVVWSVASLAQRAALPRRILRYVLPLHACVAVHGDRPLLRFAGDAYTGLLDVDPSLAARAYLKDPAQAGFQLVQSAYDALAKQLRAVDELPLSITGITPASTGLRGLSTFVPAPLRLSELGAEIPDVASYLPVHSVVLSMESSGRWPDDLAAIQEMKAAIYERLADAIAARTPEVRAAVAYDVGATDAESICDETSLELIVPAGFAFSLRIHYERERVLLERLRGDRTGSAPTRRRVAHALALYDRRFVHAPRHYAALAALHDRFPALGGVVRLVKRWFAAQMLSTQVPAEAVELLCVAVFTSNAHAPPATDVCGLARVLRLLSRWDARETPLLVPLEAATRTAHKYQADRAEQGPGATDRADAVQRRHGIVHDELLTFPPAQRTEAEALFRAVRARDPAMRHNAWVIATETDLESAAWTGDAPSADVADGVRELAKRAAAFLEEELQVRTTASRVLFTPSLEHYDFVVHVHPTIHTRYLEALHPQPRFWLADGGKKRGYKNMDTGRVELRASHYGNEPRAAFDPVAEYVRLLQTLYGDTFRLFYDEHGGTAIGGYWNADVQKPHAFKVMLGYSSRPVALQKRRAGNDVVLNRGAILAELERLGYALVDRIEGGQGGAEGGGRNGDASRV
ncbi:U3 snoRNP protein [Malassezia sp. CBS 17886]|nr:U3 snoRNP protein [Malassezia sp. CBS 17886]